MGMKKGEGKDGEHAVTAVKDEDIERSVGKKKLQTCCFNEICGLLGYYAASFGNCLPTFRDNVSVPSSRVKSPSGLF
jgi:hypothetical protein